MKIYRIAGVIFILFSILVMPYWIYVPVLFIGIFIFPFFWEAIILGFLIDIAHGSGIEGLPSFVSPFAFSALVSLIILLPVRKRLRANLSR
jgi:hypothetical protein